MADTRQVLADAIKAWHDLGPASYARQEAEYVIAYMARRNVALVEDDGEHYMDVRYDVEDERTDWTIQHPARCRPNLLACSMNAGVTRYFEDLPDMRQREGRFKLLDTNDGVGTEPA
jgi:hypothetical protein